MGDQGHLHTKLEVPRLTCIGQELKLGYVVGGEHSGKELFEQHIYSYSEHLHMSAQHGSSQCMWLHEHCTYMNTQELH